VAAFAASVYQGCHADKDDEDRRRSGTGSASVPKGALRQQAIADFLDPNLLLQTAHGNVFSPDSFRVRATSEVTNSAAAASSFSPFMFVDPTFDFSAKRWRDAASIWSSLRKMPTLLFRKKSATRATGRFSRSELIIENVALVVLFSSPQGVDAGPKKMSFGWLAPHKMHVTPPHPFDRSKMNVSLQLMH